MKKLLIILSILFLTSQTKVLNNKIEKSKSNETQESRELVLNSRGGLVLPHSVIIGQLSDYSSLDEKLFKTISRTLKYIEEGRSPDTLVDEFKFLYKVYIEEELLGDDGIDSWRVGEGFMGVDRAEYPIEIVYQEYSLKGFIYLIKNESWKVSDIQLEKVQKRVLDPSQPILY